MLYEIHNGPKRLRKIVDEAMSFIIDYLDMPEDAWVDIEFTSSGSAGGFIDTEDSTYLVEINKTQSDEEIIATLFHEMKHVEQTATGRLDQLIWEGKCYKGTAYEDRPWEKEAYAFEFRTVHEYQKQSA